MKFRRKSAAPDGSAEQVDQQVPGETPGDGTGPERPAGPYDADDLAARRRDVPGEVGGAGDEGPQERVDLGSLLLAPFAGCELRLQVDEATSEVQAVLLAADDGALELRAFAAPRHGDLWGDVRPQLAGDVQRRGGTVAEREGRWGPELLCQLGVQLPDGQTGTQISRIIGINGPRWMLRATLLGRPAVDEEYARSWEDGLTQVVVRRGAEAMPVGEALPLALPPQARPVP